MNRRHGAALIAAMLGAMSAPAAVTVTAGGHSRDAVAVENAVTSSVKRHLPGNALFGGYRGEAARGNFMTLEQLVRYSTQRARTRNRRADYRGRGRSRRS